MTDRPVIFSGTMVKALIEGRKTQTRRVIKPQPVCQRGSAQLDAGLFHIFNAHGGVLNVAEADVPRMAVDYVPYAVGDRLWVREAWRADPIYDGEPPSWMTPGSRVWFAADWPDDATRCRSPIHMPRWASRLTLLVTEVRVQRLQEISGNDALDEGMTFPDGMRWGCDPVDAFHNLWDTLHGDGAFAVNPWVAAISFTVERRNIDAPELEAGRIADPVEAKGRR